MAKAELSIRIALGGAMIAALVGLVVLDARLTSVSGPRPLGRLNIDVDFAVRRGPIITLLVASMVAWGAVEFCRLARDCGHQPATLIAVTLTILVATCPWWAGVGRRDPNAVMVGLLTVAVLAALAVELAGGRIGGAAANVGTTLFAVLYLGILSSFLVRLRVEKADLGPWYVLLVVGVVKLSDVGAFFVGKYLGKRKLSPKISPGKTWEGLLGAVLAGTITALAFSCLGDRIFSGVSAGRWLGVGQAFVFGPVMAVVGQMGDLCESALKRSAGRKDSGSTIPEFGGALDLVDSPLVAAPIAYLLLS